MLDTSASCELKTAKPDPILAFTLVLLTKLCYDDDQDDHHHNHSHHHRGPDHDNDENEYSKTLQNLISRIMSHIAPFKCKCPIWEKKDLLHEEEIFVQQLMIRMLMILIDDDDDGFKVVESLGHKLMFVIFPDLENGGIS